MNNMSLTCSCNSDQHLQGCIVGTLGKIVDTMDQIDKSTIDLVTISTSNKSEIEKLKITSSNQENKLKALAKKVESHH